MTLPDEISSLVQGFRAAGPEELESGFWACLYIYVCMYIYNYTFNIHSFIDAIIRTIEGSSGKMN